MCNHFNREKSSDVEAYERAVSEAVEKILANIPRETWGWSKDQIPVVYQGQAGRTLTTMRWGVWPYYDKTLKGQRVRGG